MMNSQVPSPEKPQNDLPDKPPPGPAGVQSEAAAPVAPKPPEEPRNDLPDKPPPGPAGLRA